MDYSSKNLLYGYSALDVSKVVLGSYIAYKTGKYAYWHYRANQVKRRAKEVYNERNAKKYSFAKTKDTNLILSLDAT